MALPYEQLIRLAAGELPPDEVADLERRLADDPEAAAFVSRFRTFVRTLSSDDSTAAPQHVVARAKAIFRQQVPGKRPSILDRLADVVAALTFDSRMQPALAGYRGASTAFALSYRSDAVEIDLDAEPIDEPAAAGAGASERWRIIGQISGGAAPSPSEALLVLEKSGETVASASADEHGMFMLEARPGRYDLVLRSMRGNITLPGIDLR